MTTFFRLITLTSVTRPGKPSRGFRPPFFRSLLKSAMVNWSWWQTGPRRPQTTMDFCATTRWFFFWPERCWTWRWMSWTSPHASHTPWQHGQSQRIRAKSATVMSSQFDTMTRTDEDEWPCKGYLTSSQRIPPRYKGREGELSRWRMRTGYFPHIPIIRGGVWSGVSCSDPQVKILCLLHKMRRNRSTGSIGSNALWRLVLRCSWLCQETERS